MVTEARKRANAKWDKENMVVLACKVCLLYTSDAADE